MCILTKRLTIRRIIAADWPSIQEIWQRVNATEVAQYDSPHPTDDETVRTKIAKWVNVGQGMEHIFFAICLRERVIGYIAFNIRSQGYEIGYCFHPDFHGKGYAKESLAALLDYMHGLGTKRFLVGTAMKNIPSVALLKSLEFQQIGVENVSFYKDQMGKDIWFQGGIFEKVLD